MVCANLRAAQAGEIAFGLVRIRLALVLEHDRVIDAVHFVLGVQRIPA